MDKDAQELLQEITRQTQSELIYFFIIIVVAMVIVMIPMYTLTMKGNRAKEIAERERLDMYIKREQQLIQVVATNTEALVSLKATQEITLNNLKAAVEAGNKGMDKSLDRVHTRLDEILRLGTVQGNDVTKIAALTDRALTNQQILRDTINNILLIVDEIPNKSHFSKQGGLTHGKAGLGVNGSNLDKEEI